MNESGDCYPSLIAQNKLSFKVVDINIEESDNNKNMEHEYCDGDATFYKNDLYSSDDNHESGDDNIYSDKDETDLEEEIRVSKYGKSGLFYIPQIYILSTVGFLSLMRSIYVVQDF